MVPKCSILIILFLCLGFFHSPAWPQEKTENEDNVVEDISFTEKEDDSKEKKEEKPAEKKEAEKKSDKDENTDDASEKPEGKEKKAETKKKVDVNLLLFKYARRLLSMGKYDEAYEICELLLKEAPDNKGLLAFKGRIVNAKRDVSVLRKYVDSDELINDVINSGITPEEPDPVDRPESTPVIELVSGMNREQRDKVKEKLNQRISLNVVNASLSYILNLLFRGMGINIIADQTVLQDKLLTVQVEKIPLEGVLNYISRLEGVTYSISHETVWITSSDKPMLETRIVRLRSGLTDVLEKLDPIDGGAIGGAAGGGPSGDESDLERVLDRIADIIEWPAGSNWVLDRKTNTLFVRSTSDALDKFEKIVAAVDRSPLQVLIEAKFVELSDGDLNDVGIEWQIANDARIRAAGGSSGVNLNTGSGTNFGAPGRTPGSVDFSSNTKGMDLFLTGVLTGPQFDAILHAINTKDSSHTLSSPTLLTMNNFVGTIKVTTDLVYIENYTVDRSLNNNTTVGGTGTAITTFTIGDDDGDGLINEDWFDRIDNDGDGSTDEDGLPTDLLGNTPGSEPVIIPTFTTEFEGVILRILPSIGLDGNVITLSLQPEVNEKVGEETFNLVIPNYQGTAEIVRPIMNRRTFVTKLSIKDGSTVVLGGLKREREIKSVSRVPILGNIPILGRLFSRSYSNSVASNLLIFVTAHILEPSGSKYKKEGPPKKVILYETPDGIPVTKDELQKILERKKAKK